MPVDLKVEFSSNKTYRKLGGPGNFLEVQLSSFRVKMNDKVKKVPFQLTVLSFKVFKVNRFTLQPIKD